jgi:hypothetical protein
MIRNYLCPGIVEKGEQAFERMKGTPHSRDILYPNVSYIKEQDFNRIVALHLQPCLPLLRRLTKTGQTFPMKIAILLTASFSATLVLAQGGFSGGQCNCGHMYLCEGILHTGDGVCCNGVKREVLLL